MHVLQSGLFLTLDFGVSEGRVEHAPLQDVVNELLICLAVMVKPP